MGICAGAVHASLVLAGEVMEQRSKGLPSVCPVARGWDGQATAAAMWAHVDECAVCQERLLRGLGRALLQPRIGGKKKKRKRESID